MNTDDFLPYVLPEVIGAPDPLVKQHIVSASAEFCSKTLAWTDAQDPIPLVDGEPEYEIDCPSGAYALTVRDVTIGGTRLVPVTVDQLPQVLPNWQTAQGSEPSYYNASGTRGSIRVYPTPANTTGQSMTVRAAFVPVSGASTLPDFLGQQHMEVIASGAKARLLMMPGVAWSNPVLAAYHKTLFDAGIVDARIAEQHDRVPGSLRAKYRAFGS